MDILKAALFGFTIAMAVGPIALMIVNTGIKHGFATALRPALGAALADYAYAVIAFTFGAVLVAFLFEYQFYLGLVSSLILVAFGFYVFYGAFKNRKNVVHALKSDRKMGVKSTFMLTLSNPLTIAVYASFVGQIEGEIGVVDTIVLSGVIFLSSLSVQVVFASFGAFVGGAIKNPAVVHGLQMASGVFIMLFGIHGLSGL